jgi:hypothetical protein
MAEAPYARTRSGKPARLSARRVGGLAGSEQEGNAMSSRISTRDQSHDMAYWALIALLLIGPSVPHTGLWFVVGLYLLIRLTQRN